MILGLTGEWVYSCLMVKRKNVKGHRRRSWAAVLEGWERSFRKPGRNFFFFPHLIFLSGNTYKKEFVSATLELSGWRTGRKTKVSSWFMEGNSPQVPENILNQDCEVSRRKSASSLWLSFPRGREIEETTFYCLKPSKEVFTAGPRAKLSKPCFKVALGPHWRPNKGTHRALDSASSGKWKK